MTRVSLPDHRTLCLHVVAHRMSEECRAEFVSAGGLRVVRQWMLAALGEDRVGELRSLLELLGTLSLDADSLRRYELGKLIKRLTKHRSPKTGIDELNAEAKKFVGTARAASLSLD